VSSGDSDSGGTVFDMECQNMGTHVAGVPSATVPPSPTMTDTSALHTDKSALTRPGNA